jgi:hypothetical protein
MLNESPDCHASDKTASVEATDKRYVPHLGTQTTNGRKIGSIVDASHFYGRLRYDYPKRRVDAQSHAGFYITLIPRGLAVAGRLVRLVSGTAPSKP